MKSKIILNEKGKVVSIAYHKVAPADQEEAMFNSGPILEENQKLVEMDISPELMMKPDLELFDHIEKKVQGYRKDLTKK